MSSRGKSRIFLSQFCFHRWALSVWLCGMVVVHWKFKPHHWHVWVNKYHSLWFLQVPYTRSQMHGGVNKRAWSGFHSWIEPINMHAGYHDSLRLVWLYSFFHFFKEWFDWLRLVGKYPPNQSRTKPFTEVGRKQDICCPTLFWKLFLSLKRYQGGKRNNHKWVCFRMIWTWDIQWVLEFS